MSIFKNHEPEKKDEPKGEKQRNKVDSDAAREERFDGTEDPVEREHNEAVAREIRSETSFRPPGI